MKTKKFIRNNPHLPVKNLRETLTYYHDTLGFYDEWTWANKDGEIKDGGRRREDMRLLFGEDPGFTDAVNNRDSKNMLAQHPEDFQFFSLAVYDTTSGRFEELYELLFSAADLLTPVN